MTIGPYLVYSPAPHASDRFHKTWHLSVMVLDGTAASADVSGQFADKVYGEQLWPSSEAAEFLDLSGRSRYPLLDFDDLVLEINAEGPGGHTTVVVQPSEENGWTVDRSGDVKTAVSPVYGSSAGMSTSEE